MSRASSLDLLQARLANYVANVLSPRLPVPIQQRASEPAAGPLISKVELRPSGLGAPFIGVFATADVSKGEFVMPYPGYLLTNDEYDEMEYYVATAFDVRIHNKKFVFVGQPNSAGANIMSVYRGPDQPDATPNVRFEACNDPDNANCTTLPYDFISVVAEVNIQAGSELFIKYHGNGPESEFFERELEHCEKCFRKLKCGARLCSAPCD